MVRGMTTREERLTVADQLEAWAHVLKAEEAARTTGVIADGLRQAADLLAG